MAKTTINERVIELLADDNPLSVATCQTNFNFWFGVQTSGNAQQVTINLVSLFYLFPMSGDAQGVITPSVTQVVLNASLGPWPLACTFSGNFADGEVTANIALSYNGGTLTYNGPIGIVPAP
ncbi:MAG TPA: hypothetical protein VGU66_23015 [Candidatus Elarobacter sp.]|nr:hypothetical protein [Candidatus Elarobacter sp.]